MEAGSTGEDEEPKIRERELEERVAILQSTLDNVDQGITAVDRDLRTVALNRRFFELLEFPPERFPLGFHMADAFRYNAERGEYGPGDIEQQVRARVELALRFEPHAFERRRPNGRIIAVKGKALPGGGIISTYTDVTEQRAAEESLRQSEERYALATRASASWIYEWDVPTGALYLPEPPAAFAWLPMGEATSEAWVARIHGDDVAGYRARLIDYFKGRAPQIEHEYRVLDATGAVHWVLERGIGVRGPDGRMIKVIGALSDITQRKLTELELRRARDQAEQALLEQTAVRMVLESLSRSAFDLDAVLHTLIESVTRLCRAEKGFIYRREGDVLRIAVDHGASHEFREYMETHPVPVTVGSLVGRTTVEARTVHIEDVLADSRYNLSAAQRLGHFRSVLGVPIVRNGDVIGVIAMWKERVEPFTEAQIALASSFSNQASIAIENARLFRELQESARALREAKEAAEEAQRKAQLASQSKSQFLANMSHEIRTPINAITGFTTLALRTPLDARQTSYLHTIQTAAQGLLRIVDDLLDFSKIEAGRLQMERVAFTLPQVVRNVAALIGPEAQRKGLALLVKIPPEVPRNLMGDPLRLGQVLMNLCANAVKFTERGEVEIRAQLLDQSDGRVRLRFAVRDTGIGLSAEQSAKLFQAFTQADASTTRRFGGTGLGLVICERLVSLMNGRIWLESIPAEGTTFFFEIDLGRGSAANAPEPAHPPSTPGGLLAGHRILLVEDNLINQQLARELLEQEGASVVSAANGRIALDLLEREGAHAYDVALIDLQMPEMDGFETTARILALPGGEGLPLIAMTAHAMVEERERCLAAGMKDHIPKPIDPELIVQVVRRWAAMAKAARAPPE